MNELTKLLSNPGRKVSNQARLLRLIRAHKSISQAGLSAVTRLQPSTVSYLIRELKGKKLLCEKGKGESGKQGGKKSVLLSLNGEYGFFSGIYIKKDSILYTLNDFSGKVLIQTEDKITNFTSESVIDKIVSIFRKNNNEISSIKGLGISVESVVSPKGSITLSPGFNWEIPEFKKCIMKKIRNIPIVIENDANCAAYFLHYYLKEKYKNIIAFLIYLAPFGIGSGIIIEKKLFRGNNGAVGEIWRPENDIINFYKNYRSENLNNIALEPSFMQLLAEVKKLILSACFLLDPEMLILWGDIANIDKSILSTFIDSLKQHLNSEILVSYDMYLPILGAEMLAADSYTLSLLKS
ncbi:MAG TPA: ROK family transcriptional regulator [Spirochaetes bacterium]|nr:ROK family transcriptional regulator [Spirochaetota bacterium]